MATSSKLCYTNKLILAPMVRVGTLPTRLLALEYGADIVYSEELIDHRMVLCERLVNPILNTVDFVSPDGRCMFRTCDEEKQRIVFQMGTADPDRAVQTAKLVEKDVAGVDVNMGCPKDFSLKGGMGAALLSNPDRVHGILTALVKAVSLPVTCKIRLLPTPQETFDLVKVIEGTGVAALAIHGRNVKQRSTTACNHDIIKQVAARCSIPVIANGVSNDISCYGDIKRLKALTGCGSVMIARAAQWNPSVFRKEGILPVDDVIKRYLQLAVDTGNSVSNTKFCVCQMLDRVNHNLAAAVQSTKSLRDICELWGLTGYHDDAEAQRQMTVDGLSLTEQKALGVASFSPSASKRRRIEVELTEEGVMELCVKYERREYLSNATPKSVLQDYCRHQHFKPPVYQTVERTRDRLFKSVLTVDEEKYSSSFWLKSKKASEQAAAIVALSVLGVACPTRTTAH